MTETDNQVSNSQARDDAVVNKLVFAALREQTRARRWRVFFMLFFIGYLTVISIILMGDSRDSYASVGKADGEKHTALVKLSGLIADGESADASKINKALKRAFEHEDTAGIVIEINSPGGSPVQASEIFDEILRLKEKNESIPVYAVVTDIAASGGYFVAAAADRVYVNKSSLVGSIGVRLDGFGFVGLMEKLGIDRRLLTAGENKGLFDPFLPEREAEKKHLQDMLDQVHGHFIDAVRQGRGERLDQTQNLFSGLIWTGEKSIELGLADAYGTTQSVARELGVEEIADFTIETDLLQRIAQRIGSSAGRSISEHFLGGYRVN